MSKTAKWWDLIARLAFRLMDPRLTELRISCRGLWAGATMPKICGARNQTGHLHSRQALQPELHAQSRVDTLTYRTYAPFYLPIPVCWLIFQGNPGCPGTCFVDRAGHELRALSASWVLGLKVCSSTALHNYTILQKYNTLKLHSSVEFGCSHRHSKTMNVAAFLFSCETQQIVWALCFNGFLAHTALTDFSPISTSVCGDNCSCTPSLLLE